MSILNIDRQASYRSRRKADAREYWLLFCILYPFLFAAALVGRVASFAHGGSLRSADRRTSVFAEAKTAAASCIPFAFK